LENGGPDRLGVADIEVALELTSKGRLQPVFAHRRRAYRLRSRAERGELTCKQLLRKIALLGLDDDQGLGNLESQPVKQVQSAGFSTHGLVLQIAEEKPQASVYPMKVCVKSVFRHAEPVHAIESVAGDAFSHHVLAVVQIGELPVALEL